jgi:hypothetical protein
VARAEDTRGLAGRQQFGEAIDRRRAAATMQQQERVPLPTFDDGDRNGADVIDGDAMVSRCAVGHGGSSCWLRASISATLYQVP